MMKLFKSWAEKEGERREALVEFLQSEEARPSLFQRFAEYLRSDEPHQIVFELLANARLRGEVDAMLATVRRQVIDHVGSEVQQLRVQMDEKITHWHEQMPRHASEIEQGLKSRLAEHGREVTELKRVLTKRAIEEVLIEHLHNILRDEVKTFIRAHSLCFGLSNR